MKSADMAAGIDVSSVRDGTGVDNEEIRVRRCGGPVKAGGVQRCLDGSTVCL